MFLGGAFVPERESSSLLRRHFTLLVDSDGLPATVWRSALSLLKLQGYLQTLPTDYRIPLYHTKMSDETSEVADSLLSLGSKPVVLKATLEHLAGADLEKIPETLRSLIVAAGQVDADLIVTEAPEKLAGAKEAEAWSVEVTNWDGALREAEIFARGHDIPWSFQVPIAYCPFGEFYAVIEPPLNLRALNSLVVQPEDYENRFALRVRLRS